MKLGDGFRIHRLLLVSHPERPVPRGEVRVHFQRLSNLIDGLVVAAPKVQYQAHIRIDDQRERVEFLGPFQRSDCLIAPAGSRQTNGIPVVGRRIV